MSPESEKRSDDESLVSVPLSRDDANALLASWRCCGAPNICGARCMDDEESHRLAQFAAFIDNEEVNNSGLRAALAASRADTVELRKVVDSQLGECVGCNYNDGPDEYCPHHGRSYNDVLDVTERIIAEARAERDAARVEVTQLRLALRQIVDALGQLHDEDDGDDPCGCPTHQIEAFARLALAEPLGSTRCTETHQRYGRCELDGGHDGQHVTDRNQTLDGDDPGYFWGPLGSTEDPPAERSSE